MTWPRNLVLIRHAESEGNVLTTDQRATHEVSTHEYALTERGHKQAALTGAWLRGEPLPSESAVQVIQRYRAKHKLGGSDFLGRGVSVPLFDVRYVSYYRRSKETMEIVCPGEKVYEDPRLAEAQRGMYHGMTREQVQARWPEELARKEREGLYHYRPPGGENWPDVELRIHSFLGTLARDYEGADVAIVCHGHWLIMFQRLMERFTIEEALTRYRAGVAPNASITHYQSVGRRLVQQPVEGQDHFAPWQAEGI